MSHKHAHLMRSIFQDPLSANIHWREVESLLHHLGAAKKGEAALQKLVDTDEGSHRLGEVALVPASSPIGQRGHLFYNTLYDENASCHIAIGRAYRFTLTGGEELNDEEFISAGGNVSLQHVDFMIGSAEMDIDGINKDGSREPVMRQGEWAFKA